MAFPARRPAGFSLIENLVALTLFLFIVLAGIEIFGAARGTLRKLEEGQTAEEALSAALERIRADIRSAGCGLAGPAADGSVAGLEAAGDALLIRTSERATTLTAEAGPGQSVLAVADSSGLEAGRTICLFDGTKSESARISASAEGSLTLSSPLLSGPFAGAATEVVLIRTISLYMDAGRAVLRRKIDAGTGQPLLEDARSFEFSIDPSSSVVTCAVRSRLGNGENHAAIIHAPNAALAGAR